jgi:hypothetical protein
MLFSLEKGEENCAIDLDSQVWVKSYWRTTVYIFYYLIWNKVCTLRKLKFDNDNCVSAIFPSMKSCNGMELGTHEVTCKVVWRERVDIQFDFDDFKDRRYAFCGIDDSKIEHHPRCQKWSCLQLMCKYIWYRIAQAEGVPASPLSYGLDKTLMVLSYERVSLYPKYEWTCE